MGKLEENGKNTMQAVAELCQAQSLVSLPAEAKIIMTVNSKVTVYLMRHMIVTKYTLMISSYLPLVFSYMKAISILFKLY